jgi:hypothetical protein
MTICKGDRVKISLSPDNWGIGTVISAENNDVGQQFKESGLKRNWYIELEVEESAGRIPLGYAYWKQLYDKGTVEKINEEKSKSS